MPDHLRLWLRDRGSAQRRRGSEIVPLPTDRADEQIATKADTDALNAQINTHIAVLQTDILKVLIEIVFTNVALVPGLTVGLIKLL